ncbi:MAG: hypothetical protein ACI92E_003061 [Oceanicoccus sp.]
MRETSQGAEVVGHKALILLILFIFSGCSELPAEQAIRSNIEEIESAIEGHRRSDVTKHLSSYFLMNDKIDKKSTQRMLMGAFLRHKNIEIIVSNISIELKKTDSHRAMTTATVALVGATNFVPDSGRLYQVTAQWQIENASWRLMTLDWK